MVRRYTTPSLDFKVDESWPIQETEDLYLTLAQGYNVLATVNRDRMTIDGQIITIQFTQEEMAKFLPDKFVECQLRGIRPDGFAWETDIAKFYMGKTLYQKVLEYGVDPEINATASAASTLSHSNQITGQEELQWDKLVSQYL